MTRRPTPSTHWVISLAAAATLVSVAAAPVPATAITTVRVASGLNRPIFVTAPEGDGRLFIIEQRGVIKILKNGAVLGTPFLDIDALVPDISGNDERGLLGLAFHLDYATNGFFYINYTNLSSNTVIARYSVSGNPDIANPASAMTVLIINQPFTNHNGGTVAFGPNDGYLYIGMGDGGSGGDPFGNAQSPATLLGKMLRIDIDGDDFPADPNRNYAIPPDNPFLGGDPHLDEIWAKGLRNPYRFSFDRANGDLYIGDVGQICWEEVDYQSAASSGGENYGWNIMEGDTCYVQGGGCGPPGCATAGLVRPVHVYGRTVGFSTTGGNVYRGAAIPSLQGTYFFADFGTARIWSFRIVGGQVTEFMERTDELAPGGGMAIGSIAGFGEDGSTEMYIVDRAGTTTGEVYKVVPEKTDAGDSGAPRAAFTLLPANPNPFSAGTTFGVELERPGEVTLSVYDGRGGLVWSHDAGGLPRGRHTFGWNGLDAHGLPVPSGVYFLRAAVEGQTLSQRLSLVR